MQWSIDPHFLFWELYDFQRAIVGHDSEADGGDGDSEYHHHGDRSGVPMLQSGLSISDGRPCSPAFPVLVLELRWRNAGCPVDSLEVF